MVSTNLVALAQLLEEQCKSALRELPTEVRDAFHLEIASSGGCVAYLTNGSVHVAITPLNELRAWLVGYGTKGMRGGPVEMADLADAIAREIQFQLARLH